MNVTGHLTIPTDPAVDGPAGRGFAHVMALDISRADAPADVVGDTIIGLDQLGGKTAFLIPFDITIDADVEAGHTYSIRAVIRDADGTLQWTTDTVYVIDLFRMSTDRNTTREIGELTMVAVGKNRQAGSDSKKAAEASSTIESAALIGSWIVGKIDGKAVISDHEPTLNFDADGRVSGTTGCNLYHASWELRDARLTVGPAASTMRACSPPRMAQESKVLKVLADVDDAVVSIDDDTLTIETSSGHRLQADRTASVTDAD